MNCGQLTPICLTEESITDHLFQYSRYYLCSKNKMFKVQDGMWLLEHELLKIRCSLLMIIGQFIGVGNCRVIFDREAEEIILSRATCEGSSQIWWREDSVMGMVKRGSLQPGGLHKTPQDFDVLHIEHVNCQTLNTGLVGLTQSVYIELVKPSKLYD